MCLIGFKLNKQYSEINTIIDTAARATVPKSITALDLFKQKKNDETRKHPAETTTGRYSIPRSIQCIGITEICGHPGSGTKIFYCTLVFNMYCDACSHDNSGKTQFILSLAAVTSVGNGANFSGVVFFGACEHAYANTNKQRKVSECPSSIFLNHTCILCCADANYASFFSAR